MKKSLSFLYFLSFVFLLNAQTHKVDMSSIRAVKTENAKLNSKNIPDIPLAETPFAQTPNQGVTASQREGIGFSIPLGSSYNIYSIVSEGPNAITYIPEINTMAFSHRQNNGEDGGSGIISFDVSTDNGATWDTSNKPLSPNLITENGTVINGNRYPNGSLYNPPGNTDPNNAYFVGSGAALWTDPDYGNNWGLEYVVSSKLDGTTDVNEQYYTVPDSNAYLPMGMVYQPDGSQWYTNLRREQNATFQLFSPVLATKLVFNETTKTFDRTVIELELNYETGLDSFAVNPRIAFSPDGMTGYAVIGGIDGDDTEVYPSVKPIVWKSTDAGETWTKQPRIMYQTLDSLISYTLPVDADGDGESDPIGSGAAQIPYMSQYDIAVDMNGDLHIYASMLGNSNVATSGDDFGTVWIGAGTLQFFHFINSGDTWEAHHIDTWLNEDHMIGDVAVDERVQAGRSPNGDYVFFTHSESTYIQELEEMPNQAPDIHANGYRVSDGFVTQVKNLSLVPGTTFEEFDFLDAGTICYFHMSSPVTKEGGDNWDHEIPLMYGLPTDFESDLEPIDYFYLSGVGFDEDEFLERGTLPPSAVEELSPEAQAVKISPNPNTGLFTVDLTSLNQNADIRIIDMMGRTIELLSEQRGQIQVNLSVETPGLYLVEIRTETEVFSKKVMKL
jgi:hypothetical protein